MEATVPKAQQDPHCAWSLTSLTAPFWRQSKDVGRAVERRVRCFWAFFSWAARAWGETWRRVKRFDEKKDLWEEIREFDNEQTITVMI